MSFSQNEVESLRLKTNEYEMIVAQHGNNTLVVIQDTADKDHHGDEVSRTPVIHAVYRNGHPDA